MWFLYILGGFVVGVIITRSIKRYKRKKMVSSWQIGDVIIFKKEIVINKKKILKAKIVGWNLDNVFIDYAEGTMLIEYNQIDYNKSCIWRKHFNDCEIAMGKKPSFDPTINLGSNSTNNEKGAMINGKRIEFLTEIECQIYLKQCLDEEDYEKAELIRKQMEKYR